MGVQSMLFDQTATRWLDGVTRATAMKVTRAKPSFEQVTTSPVAMNQNDHSIVESICLEIELL